MSVAAALAAKRRKEKKERQRQERKEMLEKEQKSVSEWFKKFDCDKNNELDASELTKLFIHLEPDAVKDDSVGPFLTHQCNDVVTQDNCMNIIKKFRYYLKQKVYLDGLFDKYDADKSGILQANELIQLMKDKARGPSGMGEEIEVDEADVETVLEVCGSEDLTGIPRENLLSAIAEWHVIAGKKRSLQKKSSFCAIL